MELTAAASFLNSAFAGYDRMILSLLHKCSNGFFTFLFKLITLLGEKGLLFFLAALIFMCFPKTRKLGVCIFGAVCCGALFTNIILKDSVARPRPLTVMPYLQWWSEIAAPAEDGFSFPSGHVTAAAAGAVAIRLIKGKKWTWPAVIWVLLMMIARNYLMAHYPTDVLAGAIIGTASAFIAYYITEFIFRFLYINRRKKWCGLVLEWSAPDFYGIPSKLGLTGKADAKQYAFRSEKKKSVPAGNTAKASAAGTGTMTSAASAAKVSSPVSSAVSGINDFLADAGEKEAHVPAAHADTDDFILTPDGSVPAATEPSAEGAPSDGVSFENAPDDSGEVSEIAPDGFSEAAPAAHHSHTSGIQSSFSLDKLKDASKGLSAGLKKATEKASGAAEKISRTGAGITRKASSAGYKGKHEK